MAFVRSALCAPLGKLNQNPHHCSRLPLPIRSFLHKWPKRRPTTLTRISKRSHSYLPQSSDPTAFTQYSNLSQHPDPASPTSGLTSHSALRRRGLVSIKPNPWPVSFGDQEGEHRLSHPATQKIALPSQSPAISISISDDANGKPEHAGEELAGRSTPSAVSCYHSHTECGGENEGWES